MSNYFRRFIMYLMKSCQFVRYKSVDGDQILFLLY